MMLISISIPFSPNLFGAQFGELWINVYKFTQETLARRSSFDRFNIFNCYYLCII